MQICENIYQEVTVVSLRWTEVFNPSVIYCSSYPLILMFLPFQCVCVCARKGAVVFVFVLFRQMKQSRCERLPFVAQTAEMRNRQTVVLHPDLIFHTAKGHSEMM